MDSVLFFDGLAIEGEVYADVSDPYITGLDTARPTKRVLLEIRQLEKASSITPLIPTLAPELVNYST